MSALAQADAIGPQTIEPTVNYLTNDGTEVFTYTGGPGSLDVRTGGKQDPHKVVMHNGRPHLNEFNLEIDGFRFVRHDTRMQNFLDEAEIKRVYYPEMEALIKAESGAKRVVVFDHTLRTADDVLREQQKIREVVRRAHNDYTEWSGPQRVRDILPNEAEELLKHRFRHHPGVAADPLSGRDPSARHRRRPQRVVRRLHHFGAPLSRPHRPDLRGGLQSAAQVVLVPAPGPQRGAGVQGL